MGKNACCFLGHRTVELTEKLKYELYSIIEKLILDESVDTFYFGSNSQFNDICYKITSELKKKSYPTIKRVYVRSHFREIDDNYASYLLDKYEDTYYFSEKTNIGKSAYLMRNYEMIDKSNFCILYFDERYEPSTGRSGTKLAYDYALKKNKVIVNIFNKLKETF